MNNVISKEKFKNTYKMFHNNMDSDINSKWKLIKEQTDMSTHENPTSIIENEHRISKTFPMVNAINRLFLKQIKETVAEIPLSNIDPLDHYKEKITSPNQKFFFKKISMSYLRKTMSKIKKSNSTSYDEVPFSIIAKASKALNPLILNLVNNSFEEHKYPENMKINRIKPTGKKGKNKFLIEGWRPINIVPGISKPIDHVMMQQITEFMIKHNLIKSNHHGNRSKRSTQTLVCELVYIMITNMNEKLEAAILAMDQSKDYDVISHAILL